MVYHYLLGVTRTRGIFLAYLDPVSWFAALQMGGVGMGWIYMRFRRLLPKKNVTIEAGDTHLRAVSIFAAIAELSEAGTRPRLVILLEGPRDWPYIGPAVGAMGEIGGEDVWVVSKTDLPIFELENLPFPVRVVSHINDANWIKLTSRLHADGAITTVTDLGSAQFPKSSECRYIYFFHSLMSTHVSYAEGAFDEYDLLLCPSALHVKEINARDIRLHRPRRSVIDVGYPLLHALVKQFRDVPPSGTTVLAPSWSNDELLLSFWPRAADVLVSAGSRVLIRLHPETMKRSIEVVADLFNRYEGSTEVMIDISAKEGGQVRNFDALVTDWSGIGVEVALAGRPVVFVNTPRKVRNAEWRLDGLESVEESARMLLGRSIEIENVDQLPDVLRMARDYRIGDDGSAFRARVTSSVDEPAAAAACETLRYIGFKR